MLLKAIGDVPSKLDRESYARRTPYFKKGKFHNMEDKPLMVKAKSGRARDAVPDCPVPIVKQRMIPAGEKGKLRTYWLGHSSILLQLGEKNILIDPVLTKYSSPFDFVGVKRYSEVPLSPGHVPKIDLLLISHDHYDHLDYQTLMQIKDRIGHIVVPLGVESFLKSFGFEEEKITTLSWWEEVNVSDIRITATPGQHFANRNPLHSNAAWWCGFCLSDGAHTVYYSGDGGYTESFREIGEKFSIDLALLECGQYNEAWPNCHMFPEETAKAAWDVKAKWMIPVHWGAFCLCNSSWNDSVKRVLAKGRELDIQIATPMIGERVEFERMEDYQKQWW
ncbi:MAG: MBL fold metallo-hydrolase [Dorea sp.]|nr:MBL fold metallo-hydrolase [Dorea sp.]